MFFVEEDMHHGPHLLAYHLAVKGWLGSAALLKPSVLFSLNIPVAASIYLLGFASEVSLEEEWTFYPCFFSLPKCLSFLRLNSPLCYLSLFP